jgi:hypothetical protein
MAYRRFPHGERFFLDKLKAHLPVKNEGLSVFHHHADPEFIKILFCGISFRRFEKPPADVLPLEFRQEV